MIKVTYSEIVKKKNETRGAVVQRSQKVPTLIEAVNLSKYLANTVNLTGKPIIEEIK